MAPSVSTGSTKVSADYRGGQQPAFIVNPRAAKDKIPGMTTVGDDITPKSHIQTTPQHSQRSRPVTVAGSATGNNGLRGPHFIKDPLRLESYNKATTMTQSQQTVSSNLPPKTGTHASEYSSIKLRSFRRKSNASEVGEQGLREPTTPTTQLPRVMLADNATSSSPGSPDLREVNVEGGGRPKPTVRRRRSYVGASDWKSPSPKDGGGQLFPKLRARASFTADRGSAYGGHAVPSQPTRARSSFNELKSSSTDTGSLSVTSRQSSFTVGSPKQQRNNKSRTSDGSSGSENSSGVHQWPRKSNVSTSMAAIPLRTASRTVDGSITAASLGTFGSPPKKNDAPATSSCSRFELGDGVETDLLPQTQPWGGIQDPREVYAAQRQLTPAYMQHSAIHHAIPRRRMIPMCVITSMYYASNSVTYSSLKHNSFFSSKARSLCLQTALHLEDMLDKLFNSDKEKMVRYILLYVLSSTRFPSIHVLQRAGNHFLLRIIVGLSQHAALLPMGINYKVTLCELQNAGILRKGVSADGHARVSIVFIVAPFLCINSASCFSDSQYSFGITNN